MTIPFILLTALVALIPALAIIDDTWTIAAVSPVLAATLMIIAIMIPVRHLDRFKHLLQPALLVVLATPSLLMVLQVIPMPVHALANPIWASASAALNQQFAAAITVDIGATLSALAQYCTGIAAGLVTAAVALDRQRASQILHLLVGISTLVAAGQIVLALGFPDSIRHFSDSCAQASVIAIAGALLSCATAIRAFDQLQQAGRSRQANSLSPFIFSGALLSFSICVGSVLLCSNPFAAIAALFGTGTLLTVFAARRRLLGRWGATGLSAAAVIALIGAFAAVPAKENADLTLAQSMWFGPATARMLSDALPAGSGAGTFNALLPIYRDFGSAASEHPTAAAAIAIEMGWPFLCGLIIVALFGAWILFSRSLARGHDYVYPAAGSGALISLAILIFANGGILNFSASLVVGVVLGLAFAQSRSGATRDIVSTELRARSDEKDDQSGRARPVPWRIVDRSWLRFILAIFGLLMIEQTAWIGFADRSSPAELWASIGQSGGTIGTTRDEISKVASIVKLRGNLWADNGFSLLPQPSTDPASGLSRANHLDQALNALTNALHRSPSRGDVWLMLAALADRYRLSGYNIGPLLKMSYYTAPNEPSLLPLRLYVALAGNTAMNEPELRELIKHDISLVLSHQPTLMPALIAAYRLAPADRKTFAENLVSEVDPGYLNAIRTR